MTKLIIQIPCYNEAQTLPQVLADLPRQIEGIDCVQTLVIDDGSTDGTAEVAASLGVDHVVRHSGNRRLARAFQTGLDTSLRLGADIIVNTDGDNQYPGRYVPDLIAPILRGQADLVIANRQTSRIAHFTPLKRQLQKWGSRVVRMASGTRVPDAPSGFRAYSREAALQLCVITDYTYTLETIIQAGKKGLKIASIPIEVNPQIRESRLIRSTWGYIKQSAATVLRIYAFYEPLRTFLCLSVPFFVLGFVLLARFSYFYLVGERGIARFVQSLFIGGISTVIGLLVAMLGVLADLNASHRRLTEEVLYRLRKQELARVSGQCVTDGGVFPQHEGGAHREGESEGDEETKAPALAQED
jgi:glycosyltransferase involved in cell wall biosynthesis